MNIKDARNAIEAILAAIDDIELPMFDRTEVDMDGKITVCMGAVDASWVARKEMANVIRFSIAKARLGKQSNLR